MAENNVVNPSSEAICEATACMSGVGATTLTAQQLTPSTTASFSLWYWPAHLHGICVALVPWVQLVLEGVLTGVRSRFRTSALRLVFQLPSRRLASPLDEQIKIVEAAAFCMAPSTTLLATSLLTISMQLSFRLTLWAALLRLKVLVARRVAQRNGVATASQGAARRAATAHRNSTFA